MTGQGIAGSVVDVIGNTPVVALDRLTRGIPGRIVEERGGSPQAARFAAYAVVQEQDDPYAKAIQSLVAHSQELERAVAALQEKLARFESAAEAAERDPLRAVK